jgi:hypothetical protein
MGIVHQEIFLTKIKQAIADDIKLPFLYLNFFNKPLKHTLMQGVLIGKNIKPVAFVQLKTYGSTNCTTVVKEK